jgi:hypothetical protein
MSLPSVQTIPIALAGGLDLASPHAQIKPGMMTEAINFEAQLTGGYRRIKGYERTAGGPLLESNSWYGLTLSDATDIVIGDPLTDDDSGATGIVAAKNTINNQVCVVDVTGAFVVGNAVTEYAGVTIESTAVEFGAADSNDYNAWKLAAKNHYRALIEPVPGEGIVLGVWVYDGDYYAFRSDGTTIVMYVADGTTSWDVVPLYNVLPFDGGVLADGDIVVGDTITGLTSGATATVKAFIKNAGSYGSTASGYMVVDRPANPAFQNNEAIQKGGVTKVVADGVDYAITFAVGANKFQFVNYNFFATSSGLRMYGCDGVNPAFEFDGETLIPILMPSITGAPFANTPRYIEAHKNYLWLAFPQGSLQSSVLGEPTVFNGFLGAAEYGMGSEIKGMRSVMDNALIIATEYQINAMYGATTDDFELKIIAANTGCIDYTMAVSIRPYILSQKGIIRVDPSQSFGNFESSTVSRMIHSLLSNKMANNAVISAGISRELNQYRIYFNDGTGVIMTQDVMLADQKLPNFTTFQYAHTPTCISSISVDDGASEVLLFGDADGYVYRENVGNNCDGEPLEYVLRTPFMSLGSHSVRKSFKHIEFDIDAQGGSDIRFSYELSYGQLHTERSRVEAVNAIGAGGYWESNNWEELYWTSPLVDQQILSITGTGHNISLLFYGNSTLTDPFTINNVNLHFLPRRLNRG